MHITSRRSSISGFSLIEMMVAMAIMLTILGSAALAMSHAMRLNETAVLITGMNNTMRIGMDLIERDMLQVGSGLPTGHVIQTPSGLNATCTTS